MSHLFRPADPGDGRPSPSWKSYRGLLYVAAWRTCAWSATLSRQPQVRRALQTCLIVLGLVVQGALLLTAAYLIDLAISLMELWAELARQHLRITL